MIFNLREGKDKWPKNHLALMRDAEISQLLGISTDKHAKLGENREPNIVGRKTKWISCRKARRILLTGPLG